MKIRHVRAVAVFGVVLIALTGARGSGGGSCGGSSSSSGSSSGGSNDNDGSSGGGSVTGGSSSADKAIRDVRINDCKLDASGKNLTARITVTNDDALDYKYDVTVQFKGDVGDSVSPATAKVDDLLVRSSASQSADASTPYVGSGDGSEYKKCVVLKAGRILS